MPNQKTTAIPRHFRSLDALRGLAALAVVIYHWQHFSGQFGIDPERLPLYFLLEPVYKEGWRAVDLFFCLSGFIFFWLYSENIRAREVSPAKFFILRFSRLYPLHFVTLLFVAFGQQAIHWRCHQFFVYSHNDICHFVLQLLFASNWGTGNALSFNGPVWSVSVEVLLYALFFLTCFVNLRRWWHLALFAACGCLLRNFGFDLLNRGISSFFVGGLSFGIYAWFPRKGFSPTTLQCLCVLAILLWVVIPLNTIHDSIYIIYRTRIWNESLNFHGKDIFGVILLIMRPMLWPLLLFPLTIVTLALWETRHGAMARSLEFLGNISYSSYLLHFPLQLVFFGCALFFGVPGTFFCTPLSLIVFLPR